MRAPPLQSSNLYLSSKLPGKSLILIALLLLLCHNDLGHKPSCDQHGASSSSSSRVITFAQAQQRFVDASTVRPSLALILPQSFKVPTNPLQGADHPTDLPRLQQYVAVINNAQDDLEDEKIRQQYKQLSLQVRDARSPLTGQLFYEHTFNYFAPNSPKFMLIPINLEQVSLPYSNARHSSSSSSLSSAKLRASNQLSRASTNPKPPGSIPGDKSGGTDPAAAVPTAIYQPQQLIVSIRPSQSYGTGDSTELVSSSPIVVEAIPSSDGRRTFSIVQTDKPIYKPSERVKIRAMVVDENLRPIIGDEFKLQIRNPHKIIVESLMYPRALNQSLQQPAEFANKQQSAGISPTPSRHVEPMFIDHVFEFPPEPMLGKWSVHLLHSDPIANDSTTFEVKEYVLPPFELTLESPKYILPSTQHISGSVTAKYHFGRPVQGKVQFKFGYMTHQEPQKTKFVARSNIKTIDPASGRTEYNISLEKFMLNDWFPNIAESRLVIEATVTEMTTGYQETARDTSCIFITMPHVISFEESIEDFKPGLTQHLSVKVIERLSLQPGPPGMRILAEFRDQNNVLLGMQTNEAGGGSRGKFDTEALTDSAGKAVFKVGPVSEGASLIRVTLKLIDSNKRGKSENRTEIFESRGFTGVELAIGNHTLHLHDSQNGWIALMNKSLTHVNVGDQFISDILIRDAMVLPEKIFYTITARGQILTMGSLNKEGLVSFKVTELMMPSIRLVLFALTHDSIGLLSDSMRINVDQTLDCGMKLQFKYTQVEDNSSESPLNTVRPNAHGRLDITARQGDVVSLIGVDNAVYSLNNRTRLDGARIIDRIKLLDTGCGFGGGKNNLDVFHNAGLMFYNYPASDSLGHIGSLCQANPMKYLEEAAMGYSKPMLSRIAQDLEAAGHISSYTLPRSRTRTKREVDAEEVVNSYKEPLQRACCRLGTLEDVPQNRNCSVRKRIVEKYMRRGNSCAIAYYECCKRVSDPNELRFGGVVSPHEVIEPRSEVRIISQVQSTEPSRTFGQLDKIEAETLIRRDFRETWLFDLVGVEDPSGKASLEVQLPHSISSWSVQAMALNQYKPMCIMPRPFRLNTFQEVFIKLSMPYKIVQGEQIDLVATLFNYSPTTQDVIVYMYGVEDLCSDAEPGERSEQRRVRVDKLSSQAIIFSMIPLKIGKYPIKVVAVTLNSNNSDIIERELNVVPRGKPVIEETTFSLDPMNQQRRSKRAIQTGNLLDEIDSARGLQRSTIHLRPARDAESIVPETQECIVSAIGDKLGHAIQTAMVDVENLIRLPHGCGEQVMVYLGPTLYTTKYLESINKLSGDLRWRAIRYIQSGYKRILDYRKEDGSFSAFSGRYSSIWLTAFVAKMLCQTERTPLIADEVHVDKTVINSALKWLLQKQHKKMGTWLELNPVYHREILGGILRESLLSAFVTLTLNECAHHAPDIVDEVEIPGAGRVPQSTGLDEIAAGVTATNSFDRLKIALQKAEEALLRERHKALREKNPYVMSLLAYALSFNKPHEAASILDDLMPMAERVMSKNWLYWRMQSYHVETVSYALQAIIELAPLVSSRSTSGPAINVNWKPGADALAMANWLSSRRVYSGAFESTQDTIVGLEALSKFAQLQSSPNGNALVPQSDDGAPNLSCNVTIRNRMRRSLEFGKENAQILQTFKLDAFDLDPVSNENLEIVTSGSGLGTMSVRLKYNVFQADDELCRFNIDSTIEEWKPSLSTKMQDFYDKPDGSRDQYHGSVPMSGGLSSSSEDNFFKTFDKSMLNELNLVDLDAQDDGMTPPQRRANPNPASPMAPYLRVRRLAPTPQAGTVQELSQDNESWTSKMVSSLRAKLPDWMMPKSTTTQKPLQTNTINLASTLQPVSTTVEEPSSAARRNATSRRSALSQTAPIITRTTPGIPSDAHLNPLSKQFELTGFNKSANATTVLETFERPSHRLVLLLQVCTYHMSSKRDSEMAVIEIGILSGFKPNEADLKEIINKADTTAMKYELSADRSLVVFYMKYIPSSVPECFQFRLVRDSAVYNLQSGYIRVYEYYSPTYSCSSFYTPARVNNLIDTRCDPQGQVCQCATRSLCPATKKLLHMGEVLQVNATSARNQLVELICSTKYDLVSLVRLKSVRYLEAAKMFKLAVKIKSDLKGNLTRIIDEQRQQKAILADSVRKPSSNTEFIAAGNNETLAVVEESEETSLDYLNLNIDSSCVREDPLLLHFAHPNQWKQGGEVMILFARSDKLERKYFKSTPKAGSTNRNPTTAAMGPRPKPNTFKHSHWAQQSEISLPNYDAQNQQYSLTLPIDKDTILHDITYQAKVGPRESINNLLLWAELKSRRERSGFACQATSS